MVYVELRGFLDDIFKGRGKEVMQDGMSHVGFVDVDQTNHEERKKFADYLLKNHMHFSAQKNRLLYEQMLNILEIGTEFDLMDYRETIKETKKEENIITASLTVFWAKIEQAYAKYEVILNLFWLKGVEAEMHGKDRKYVGKIIGKALISVRHDARLAYRDLLRDLDLNKYMQKRKPHLLKIRLFDDIKFNTQQKVPDKEMAYLLNTVQTLFSAIDKSSTYIEKALLESMEEDLKLKANGKSDDRLVVDLQNKLIQKWNSLKDAYEIIYKKIEKEFT